MSFLQFSLKSAFTAQGDQPQAIKKLYDGLSGDNSHQVLLGVTGSGKTFTMANVIEKVKLPTLVLAHNKTLAAQLCSEFREFFPNNAVEYFVSYYDYYQPEAYMPSSDIYIEKEATVNDEIDKLRHSATSSLFERSDCIIVASVSCIYGLGNPQEYRELMLSLRPGMIKDRDDVLRKLVDIQYERNDINFVRGTFRVRGDVLEIYPASSSGKAVRVEFFGDEIERITEVDVLTGEIIDSRSHVVVFPASHYATSRERLEQAIVNIERDLDVRIKELKEQNKLLEAQRLLQRTNYDIEMMNEVGYCNGIENYSRYLDGRLPGEPPYTLLDYFPKEFLLFVDESHVTIPQVRAMYAGDRSRKDSLVQYGFRLPAAYDNRPLTFEEFEQKLYKVICVSATPGPYELGKTSNIVEQIIRPTGLVDPEIDVRPVYGQIDNLMSEISGRVKMGDRVLVTTMTKKMAEALTEYMADMNVKVRYLHSDIETIERMEIIRDFRKGEFDVLVGINLLREGLDLPEVSLVAILDADKEGFLRSETSLIQTIGRAARNINGKVIMYADNLTGSMKRAIDETNRRRRLQTEYNEKHNITPKSIVKEVYGIIEATHEWGHAAASRVKISAVCPQLEAAEPRSEYEVTRQKMSFEEKVSLIEQLEKLMKQASIALEFEKAAKLRDEIIRLRAETGINEVDKSKNNTMRGKRTGWVSKK